jgi:hypothetical protein
MREEFASQVEPLTPQTSTCSETLHFIRLIREFHPAISESRVLAIPRDHVLMPEAEFTVTGSQNTKCTSQRHS